MHVDAPRDEPTGNQEAGRQRRARAALAVLIVLLTIGVAICRSQLCSLVACRLDPEPAPTPTSWPRPRTASPEYGMQVFTWWLYDPIMQRDLDLVRDAGFGWAKQHVAWSSMEGIVKGAYDWAMTDRMVTYTEKIDLDLLFRIDSPPFWARASQESGSPNGPPEDPQDLGDFCHALAERYQGRVRAYQVWNEPNLSREWGGRPPDPAGYVELLRACYVGVKTGDPDALVITAGLAPTGSGPPDVMPDVDYLVGMYEAGAAPYFDLLGVNAPGYKAPPELSPDDAADPELGYGGQRFFCFRHVEDAREIMVRYGDEEKQVAVLEMGWSTDPRPDSPYHWHAVTSEEQADYLVRAFRFAREEWSPWIGPMVVITLANGFWANEVDEVPEENEQYWWAITEPGWPETEVRPAYEALRDMEK